MCINANIHNTFELITLTTVYVLIRVIFLVLLAALNSFSSSNRIYNPKNLYEDRIHWERRHSRDILFSTL